MKIATTARITRRRQQVAHGPDPFLRLRSLGLTDDLATIVINRCSPGGDYWDPELARCEYARFGRAPPPNAVVAPVVGARAHDLEGPRRRAPRN